MLNENYHGQGGWQEYKPPKAALRRQIGKPCAYCHVPLERSGRHRTTRDHAFPKHQGWRLSDMDGLNKVFVCNPCNAAKKGHDIVEWWWRLDNGNDRRAPIVLEVIRSIWMAGHLPNGHGKPYAAVRAVLGQLAFSAS